MKNILTTIGAFALGAGAMYYLDPESGRRRRAMVRDRVTATRHDTRDYLKTQGKRAGDRAYGWYASARGTMREIWGSSGPSDERLNARIRSRLGRLLSHPHAVETEVHEGRVVLRGPILRYEQGPLLAAIWTMRGVGGVDNQLALHDEPGSVPGLQGRPQRAGTTRMRALATRGLPALAIVGGLGALLGGAGRGEHERHVLPATLTAALLAYGLSDGARRIVRRRRAHPAPQAGAGGGARKDLQPPLPGKVGTSASAAPVWQH